MDKPEGGATMTHQASDLNERRKQLGITIRALSRLSKVPVATVNRILANPGRARFDHVAAVGNILGIDFLGVRSLPVKTVLANRVLAKATYIARVVQGTQGLEAAGLNRSGYHKILNLAVKTLKSGKKQKLWDED